MNSLKLVFCFGSRKQNINTTKTLVNFSKYRSSCTLSSRNVALTNLQTSMQSKIVLVDNLSIYKKSLFIGENGSRRYRTFYPIYQEEKGKQDQISSEPPKPEEKLSLVKRYKKMLKEYWYVLIPVHLGTSAIWFGTFYYSATCGFDIVPLLEKIGISETIINPFRNSSLGYIAVASALYKLSTPARYMVTLGGTTVAIKYLKKKGLIKPVPSKDKIKSMIQKKLHPQDKQAKSD